MNKYIYVALALLTLVVFSFGCMAERPNLTLDDLSKQLDALKTEQAAISDKFDAHQYQINSRLSELTMYNREQTDLIRAIRNDMLSLETPTKNNLKIEISLDRGGYGEAATFGSISEAIQFLNSLK